MEIGKSYFSKVSSFVESTNKNPNIELEVRFWNPSYEKIELNEEKFKKIFEYYTFSKENDGLGASYKMVSSLDICISVEGNSFSNYLDRTRLTIEDSANIKKYWLQDNLEGIPHKMIEKKKLEKLDLNDYFVRVSMNEELPEEEILEKNKKQLLNLANNVATGNNATGNLRNQKMLKHFRLKNRYNITTPDGLFMIDLTTLKSKSGKNFREANVLKESPTYEIEIEYIGNKPGMGEEAGAGAGTGAGDAEKVTAKLFEHVHTIMSILNDSDFIMKHAVKGRVNAAYKNLVNVRRAEDIPSYSNEFRPEFICANPVTIHRVNLVKSTNVNNILNRYAVTLKADGQRMCAFVMGSENPELNGNIYFIDINEQVIDSGLKDESCVGSLVEGEYTKLTTGKFEFFAYDILFFRGNDVRRNQYYSTYRDERAGRSRSEYLQQFIGSVGRKERTAVEGSGLSVTLRRKEFKISDKADGLDIFEKAKQVWDSRTSQPFFVDGLIFTPMFEHYPMRGGSWYALFKWKPTHLNSIDFLVETTKNNAGSEMKFPYLVNEIEKDGRIKTSLKQYKKVRLYVGTLKDAFNEKTHRMTKRKYKTLFNPYGLENMDTEAAEAYYTAHIFTDENDRMVCHDPITGETEPIYDDTIVEFGFDRTREKGFQWIPFRVRHDKTTSYKNGRFVFGNLDKTAYDIFRSQQYPIDDEMITTGKLPPMEENGETPVDAPYYAAFKEGVAGTGTGADNGNNGPRLPFQNFHNHHIKLSLLKQVNEQTDGKKMVGKVLDLCCGKCVDIPRMKMALFAEVVCMDIDLDNIKFGQKYYDRVIPKPKPKAFFIRGDAGKLIFPNQDAGMSDADKMKIQSHIETKYLFDVVNVQFALHYFFENEMRLRTLLQNVNDNLKIGGYFIGTSFDGERVYNLIKGVTEVEGKDFAGNMLWKIKKQYTTKRMAFDKSKSNFGKQIDVFVRSIGNVHAEYLVNYNFLDAILEEYGFEKVMVKPFGEFHDNLLRQEYDDGVNGETMKQIQTAKKMSDEEQKFSFLNNAFIYRKVRNSSDALFKKLVKMIEEQSKKTLAAQEATMPDDPAVETMDEDAGHLAIAAEEMTGEKEAPLVPEEEAEPQVEELLEAAALDMPSPAGGPEPVDDSLQPSAPLRGAKKVEEVPDANDLTNNADADADANVSEEQSGGAAKKRVANGRFAKSHPMKSTVVKRKK